MTDPQRTKPAPDAIAYLVVVGGFCALALPWLDRVSAMTVDEPWYAQYGYALRTMGSWSNPIVVSFDGEMIQPVYVAYVAALQVLFGTTFWAARLGSVVAGAAAVAAVVALLRQAGLARRDVVLVGGAFAVSNLTWIAFRQVRPEALGVALVAWAAWALVRSWRTGGVRWSWVSAGLLAAAALVHPHFALLAVLVGVFVVVVELRTEKIATVSMVTVGALAGLVAASVWLSMPDADQETLRRNVVHRSVEGGTSPGTWAAAVSLVERLLAGGRRVVTVAVELAGVAWLVWKARKRREHGLFATLFGGFVVVGLLALDPFSVRALTAVQWVVFVALGCWCAAWKVDQPRGKWLRIAVVVALLNNLAGDVYVMVRDQDRASYQEVVEKLEPLIPKDAKVAAPMLLWFSVADNAVCSDKTKWHRTKHGSLRRFLAAGGADVVVTMNTDGIRQAHAGATGKSTGTDDYARFYLGIVTRHLAARKARKLGEFAAAGYGRVSVWSAR